MCGIAGIAWQGNVAEKRQLIQRMTDAMAHRGPDADGHFVNEHVALGQRRLSIIDLSTESNQPFWDASGRYCITYNGEIYNYRELRSALPDFPYKTNSDTEVILAAYHAWGEECLHRFFGMFALAIWDTQRQSLFIARDRLGIKPLYFFKQEQQLLFASEIRALLKTGLIRKELDPDSLRNYLTYQTVHAPKTIIQGVEQLMPGECAVWKNGEFKRRNYWKLAPNNAEPCTDDYATVKKQVRELLTKAVERRLVSDVPLGAFLSGGIDSSAVVALMAETSGRQIDTFSIVFEDERFDESYWSNMVAKKFNTRHHPLLLHPEDFLASVPEALQAIDSPSGDGLNSYVVSKMTKQAGVTVALSGLGGDELFAGYSIFKDAEKLQRWRHLWALPKSLRTGAATLAGAFLKNHQQARVVEMAAAPNASVSSMYPAMRKLFTPGELGLLNGASSPDAVRDLLKAEIGLSKLPLLSQVSVADISTYTQNVLLRDTDQMSMAHALEVRVPFFDHALVEYVLQIPDKYKHPDYPKKLLVESLKPLLPDEVVFRPKRGFVLPWTAWMKNELKSFCEAKINRWSERGLVAPQVPQQLWRQFLAGENDSLYSRIWIFVVLEDWLERNID